MKYILAVLALLIAAPVSAQVSGQGGSVTPDMIPKAGTGTPRTETVGGAVGGDTMEYAPFLHQHPRITRTDVFTLSAANGMIVAIWDNPLPPGYASYPVFFTPIGAAGTSPLQCMVISSSNTGFSAQCRRPLLSLALLGPLSDFPSLGSQVFALQIPSAR